MASNFTGKIYRFRVLFAQGESLEDVASTDLLSAWQAIIKLIKAKSKKLTQYRAVASITLHSTRDTIS